MGAKRGKETNLLALVLADRLVTNDEIAYCIEEGSQSTPSGRNGYDFKAVKRWTTQKKLGYGLIGCDKIFVPIHKEVHWCLAIINVKDKKFQYLDSLGGMDKMALRVLARYLVDEVSDKSNKQIETTHWGQEIIEDLPLQENGFNSLRNG